MLSVSQLLSGKPTNAVWSLHSEQTVIEALELMAEKNIGAVMVIDDGHLVGIFSERDIVRLISSYGPDALDRRIDGVMTKSPVTCEPNMAVIAALSQ
ncbi:MAG: CBS domain-containing protein, partial [Saprospiraceae bacterium]